MLDAIGSPARLIVVTRFRVPAERFDTFAAGARDAIAALAACAGFVDAELGQATDDAELRLIVSRWTGIGAYRRALGDYQVKLTAIPFLSMAVDEPSAFEVVHARTSSDAVDAVSGRAADADEVALGEAAGPDVPAVTA